MYVNSYKDYDGNIVKVGDVIDELDYDGNKKKPFGRVLSIEKQGFYIWVNTTFTIRKQQLWGKFTRKVR